MILVQINAVYPLCLIESSYEKDSCAVEPLARVCEGHHCTITELITYSANNHFLEVF